MKRKIGIAIAIAFIICLVGNVLITIHRIGEYKENKPYEELTATEKLSSKLAGYKFKTKEELIEEGLLLTEEQEEASKIYSMISLPIEYLRSDTNNDNVDFKIGVMEAASKTLHEENSSGRVNTENLRDFMDNSINLTQDYMLALKAYKDINVNSFNIHMAETTNDFKNIINCIDRLEIKKINDTADKRSNIKLIKDIN